MTKYFATNIQEWDYDDLIKNEFLVFSTPDNFEFGLELLEKYLGFIGLSYKSNDSGGVDILKKGRFWYNTYIYSLFEDNMGENGIYKPADFIKWLKQFGVEQLEYKIIE
jgi:hypothetical protein